ncbi:uncharacterized protein LOC122193934 isoform X1 [Lagopus leucura]|uniref:uncharacterized protein LOC122193934 isoform X1 n=1 Tax=Lagopus leucura TaxID=30410 RepID=UPI001C677943|nr:uncharacterized protein LOC122193934 isoform X1 [Lagopus leucura]
MPMDVSGGGTRRGVLSCCPPPLQLWVLVPGSFPLSIPRRSVSRSIAAAAALRPTERTVQSESCLVMDKTQRSTLLLAVGLLGPVGLWRWTSVPFQHHCPSFLWLRALLFVAKQRTLRMDIEDCNGRSYISGSGDSSLEKEFSSAIAGAAVSTPNSQHSSPSRSLSEGVTS